MATASWTVTKQMMGDINASGDANPGDLHIPIGYWSAGTGYATRAALYAPISFAGMTGINEARLYLRANAPSSGYHTKGTSTASIYALRKTADWSETSHGGSAAVDELWGADGRIVTNNYLAGVVSGDLANMGALTDGAWYYVTITGIVQAWFAGNPNYGLLIYNATSESNASYSKQFWSRHASGSEPYIWIDYSTNTAPYAPTNLSPTASQTYHSGTAFTASGSHSDPDAGDYLTGYQIIVYLDDGASAIIDTGYVGSGASATFNHALNVGGYGANRFYRWIARTWDKAGVVGPWSAQQRFKLNSVPNAPTINTPTANDATPTLSGTFSDPDPGDGLSQVNYQVVRNSDGAVMWDTYLSASGTSFSTTYGGTALVSGTQYRWNARTLDTNGAWSGWTSWNYWTYTAPTGPTISPRSNNLLTDTTPDLTISYGSQFTDHEIYVYSSAAGGTAVWSDTPVAYAATTSKVVTVGTALTPGVTYYWKARVYLTTATWTDWTGFASGQSGNLNASFRINSTPTKPTGVTARNNPGVPAVTRSTDGMLMVTDRVPLLEAVYTDAELSGYNDVPTKRSIEIYNDSTSALVHSDAVTTSLPYTTPMRYFPGTITNSTTLAAAAVAGATNIKVTAVTGYAIGDRIRVGPAGATQEIVTISTVGTAGSGGTGLTLSSGLLYDHANAEAIAEITPVLANETTYKMRWQFADVSGTYGVWSDYVQFKVTQPSTLSTVAPSGTVTSPSFTITWNHASPGSKAQGAYRVRITRDSDAVTVHDTGWVTSSTESYALAAGVLQNSTAYTITVDAVDTDGI